ncbi:PAM68 family protein [Candidatus Synechococcus spongiarum]|uniref:DUF3464 family protein n=1 Tax=Candidatus Synechococcus spongiarum TaxID=431041 RepID=A0A170T902_9SYNE|nr:PAM68 family protein [Candidatus Synechococcus spongiarum]CZB17711.1 hypothetical protein FLM9_817 [Candidatus Synechococcus spongiarum]
MATAEPAKGFGGSEDAGGQARKRKVEKTHPPQNSARKATPRRSAIPDHVSRRMVRRVLLLSGAPTLLAMGVFVLSYLLMSQGTMRIEPIVTVGVSGVFFVLGLLGLSYGMLSASWDDGPGSLLGLEHFGKNLQRLRASLRTMKGDR